MNKILIPFIISVSILCFTVKYSHGKHYYKSEKENNSDSVLIIKLENDFGIALINRDEKMLNKLISDDFFYTENEKIYTREEVMQAFLAESEKVESAYNEDMQVHFYDNTAIVTGWLYVNGKGTGGDFKRKYRFTDIWFKKNGDWQIIAAQDYLLP